MNKAKIHTIGWLMWLLPCFVTDYAFGQQTGWVLDDLAYVIQDTSSRQQVIAAMQQLYDSTQVAVVVTTLSVQDPYSSLSQQQTQAWLHQQALGLSVVLTTDNRTKAFQKCEITVSPAVEALLPAADRQQIQADLMEYYFRSSMVPTDAYTEGLTAGLRAMWKKIAEHRKKENNMPEDIITNTETAKDKGYYVTTPNDTTKYRWGDELVYIKHKGSIKLTVSSEKDALNVADLRWEMNGKEAFKGKAACEFDLGKEGNYKIEVYTAEDKVLKLHLDVYGKPMVTFAQGSGYNGEYGFDEAGFQQLQLTGDYEKLTINSTDYYVPFMTLQPNQQVIIKLDAKGLASKANKDKDFKVIIKSTDPKVTIDEQTELIISYSQLKGKTPIFIQTPNTKDQPNLNAPQYLIAEDHKGDEIGKLAFTYGEPVNIYDVVFVYVNHGTGISSKSTSDILHYLNLKSHNQFFRKWDILRIDTLDISTSYKVSKSTYTASVSVLNALKSDYEKLKPNQTDTYYFFITNLSVTKNGTDKVGGQAYLNGFFGAVYEGGDNEAISHEFGHLLRLKHTFDSSLDNRQILKGTTKNYMDYKLNGKNMFFLYQMKLVK